MIERNHPDLSISQQCALLSIPRSSLYSAPQGETEQNLALMRLIDVQFLETPFFGVRQVTWHLRNDGHAVNEKRIRWLMRLMAPPLGRFTMQIACRAVDQGPQFTSFAWTDRLRAAGIRISMDGKGRCLDNIFMERLWRTLKYECVYLHAWETGSQARAGVRQWMGFYNFASLRPSFYVVEENRFC
jgi:hypothetical protein